MADLGAVGVNPATPVSVRKVVSPVVYASRAAGDPKLVEIDVGGVISGTVLVSGIPRAGVSVGLFYRPSMRLIERAITASDGTYSFNGLDRSDLESFTVLAQDPNDAAPFLRTAAHDHLSAG
jgi:hypothetical protein